MNDSMKEFQASDERKTTIIEDIEDRKGKKIQIQYFYEQTPMGWVVYHHTEVYWHNDKDLSAEVHLIMD